MSAWQPLMGDTRPQPGGVDAPALALCDHLTAIRAEGEEAGDYLQGQLTCDLAHIDAGAHRAALHLSLKGRGLISLRLARAGDGYLLICPTEQVDATIRALNKYKLRAKVTFTPDDTLLVAQLAGTVEDGLAGAGLPVPEPGQVDAGAPLAVLRYPHSEHALLIGDAGAFGGHWRALTRERTVTDGDGARYQDVRAGEAQIYPGAEDRFLPQMLNYDVLGGVSFKKGCYTGQEVVARMHFKGKLKQRMKAFAHDGGRLTPGESLRDGNGRAVGEVVDSAPGEPRALALVVVRLDHEGELYRGDQALDAAPVALPYALPKAKA